MTFEGPTYALCIDIHLLYAGSRLCGAIHKAHINILMDYNV